MKYFLVQLKTIEEWRMRACFSLSRYIKKVTVNLKYIQRAAEEICQKRMRSTVLIL